MTETSLYQVIFSYYLSICKYPHLLPVWTSRSNCATYNCQVLFTVGKDMFTMPETVTSEVHHAL